MAINGDLYNGDQDPTRRKNYMANYMLVSLKNHTNFFDYNPKKPYLCSRIIWLLE